MNDFESVESSLKNHLPEGEYEQVRRILYGKDCKGIRSENILGLCGEKMTLRFQTQCKEGAKYVNVHLMVRIFSRNW